MSAEGRNIIVIGASAGGLDALDALIGQLPTDLPASIFIAQHMSPENTGEFLIARLQKHRAFDPRMAADGDVFQLSKVYIAPPDYHLLVKKENLLVTKGARENRFRPAIDPLFRSAAVNHTSRVIGVVLTGMLNDGTEGLVAIHKCGGVTIVQDPKDAQYPEMPESAMANLKVDHCIALGEMGALLEKLAREHHGGSKPVPDEVRIEAEIAERVLSDVRQVNKLGTQVPYNCPNCGGVLWELKKAGLKRFRCHTGHSFTEDALLISQSEKIEETLWVSLRMFEERKNLLHSMSNSAGAASLKHSYEQRANETDIHIQRIRAMLTAPEAAALQK